MGNYDFALDLESQNTQSVINAWIEPNSEVLEFGSANGRLTKYLSEEKGCAVTIVEIDEASGQEAAQFAKKSYVGLEYGNIGNYYWEKTDDRYQYIIFADVLEHLANPKEVLYRAKALLKEHGRILISIPNVTHNSILIDMMNDKFEYSATGLLDNTHIHFFTYKTFKQMVQECDLYICETVPIYSRVGNNEIENSFDDVPIEVAQYLRTRIEGSVYQYVFSLSPSEADIQPDRNRIEALEVEAHEALETALFYKKEETAEYTDSKRVSKIYQDNEKVSLEINMDELENSEYLCWSPMAYNGVVRLECCQIVKDGQSLDLQIKNGNMLKGTKSTLVFTENLPWVEFEKIPEEWRQGRVNIVFSVLVHKKTNDFYELLESVNAENQKHINLVVDEQKSYITHLESDIAEQQEYVAHLEKDIAAQQEYITHLENDIKELKEYIENK